jgi:hypothetical protein
VIGFIALAGIIARNGSLLVDLSRHLAARRCKKRKQQPEER